MKNLHKEMLMILLLVFGFLLGLIFESIQVREEDWAIFKDEEVACVVIEEEGYDPSSQCYRLVEINRYNRLMMEVSNSNK